MRRVPFAVWRLMLAYSLMMAGVSVLVFSIQALASLSSGWVLYTWKWDGVLWACIPLVLAFLVLLALSKAPVSKCV